MFLISKFFGEVNGFYRPKLKKKQSGLETKQNGSHGNHYSIYQFTFVWLISVQNMEETVSSEQIL